jgi:4-amino-4-deoxy-L-arabinose transferase-like glycosyltransferase
LLLACAAPVFVMSLGSSTIWDANEAFYVETPRQMIVTGDYVTPVFNGAERLNKPVLSYWIVAALYQAFGVSVGVERFGIAIGALGIVLAAFLIGWTLRSATVGVLAALIVATAPRFVMWGRRIFIDIWVTMFMSLALAAFVLAERFPAKRRVFLIAMYVAIGLGVLTKGPVAIVLPAAALAVWLTSERRWADSRRLMLVPGLVIVAAIVVPWYAALVLRHGWAPVTGFFVGENLDRFTTAMQPDHRPFWFYLPVLLTDLFPWAPLLAPALASAWRRDTGEDAAGPQRRLLWIWTAAIAGAFSLSATKQDLYVFPVVAACAALIADELVTAFRSPRLAAGLTIGAVGLLSAAAGVLVFNWFGGGSYYSLPGARVAAVVLGSGGLATAALIARRRVRSAAVGLASTYAVVNYVIVLAVLPAVERFKPVAPLAQVFRSTASEHARLGGYRLMLPSLVYYANRPVQAFETPEEARAFFGAGEAWSIVDDHRFAELRGAVPDLCVIAERPRMDPTLGDVIAGRPPGNVLLVTNRCGPTN